MPQLRGVDVKVKSGWKFHPFPVPFPDGTDEDLCVSHDEMPVQLDGMPPIGLREWYSRPPMDKIRAEGDWDSFCPMRGSKAGIRSFDPDGRVGGYDYFMAHKAGYRFGRWCIKTGCRVLVANTRREAFGVGRPGRMGEIPMKEFSSGFGVALSEHFGVRNKLGTGLHDQYFENSHPCAKAMQGHTRNGSTAIFAINMLGLDQDTANALVCMTAKDLELEALQIEMESICKGAQ